MIPSRRIAHRQIRQKRQVHQSLEFLRHQSHLDAGLQPCPDHGSQGSLFVGNRGNNRIEIFDQEGNLLAEWKQFGKPSGTVHRQA